MIFLEKLWEKPIHMLIVVCVFLSILTMGINFVRRLVSRNSSEPVKQVAETLENRQRM